MGKYQCDVVKFIKYNGEILALFPNNKHGKYILCYAHLGQHGEAHQDLLSHKSVAENEYIALASELRELGYNLSINN